MGIELIAAVSAATAIVSSFGWWRAHSQLVTLELLLAAMVEDRVNIQIVSQNKENLH